MSSPFLPCNLEKSAKKAHGLLSEPISARQKLPTNQKESRHTHIARDQAHCDILAGGGSNMAYLGFLTSA